MGIAFVALLCQGMGIAYSAAAANVLVARASASSERALAIAATNLGSRLTLVVAGPILSILYGVTPELTFVAGAVLLAGVAAAIWAEKARTPSLDVAAR